MKMALAGERGARERAKALSRLTGRLPPCVSKAPGNRKEQRKASPRAGGTKGTNLDKGPPPLGVLHEVVGGLPGELHKTERLVELDVAQVGNAGWGLGGRSVHGSLRRTKGGIDSVYVQMARERRVREWEMRRERQAVERRSVGRDREGSSARVSPSPSREEGQGTLGGTGKSEQVKRLKRPDPSL